MRFRGGFSLSEAFEALGALALSSFPSRSFHFQSLDDPEEAGPESLVILGSRSRLETRSHLNTALILAETGVDGMPSSIPIIRVANARRALAALVNAFADRAPREEPRIGQGTRIEPGAFLHPGVRIGRDCLIQSGAVIGCAGFGFFDDGGDAGSIPHFAGVEIGDGCFVGANTVIAAGVLHSTVLGDGCKLDSLVQIAHNVRLGKGCLLASQSGIAGSTVIGDFFRMGGAASVAGHLRIGKNVGVAARSGVTKDLSDHAVVAGFPAMPIRSWRRREALLRRMEKAGTLPEGEWA